MSDNAVSRYVPDQHRHDAGSALMTLTATIARIDETIDTETRSIRTDVRFDIKASNARKSRYLYELSRAIAGLGGNVLQDEQKSAIIRLREKLAANETAILAHLNAVGEVATLMQDAIQRAEADGTYSASEFGRLGQTA